MSSFSLVELDIINIIHLFQYGTDAISLGRISGKSINISLILSKLLTMQHHATPPERETEERRHKGAAFFLQAARNQEIEERRSEESKRCATDERTETKRLRERERERERGEREREKGGREERRKIGMRTVSG